MLTWTLEPKLDIATLIRSGVDRVVDRCTNSPGLVTYKLQYTSVVYQSFSQEYLTLRPIRFSGLESRRSRSREAADDSGCFHIGYKVGWKWSECRIETERGSFHSLEPSRTSKT